MRSIKLQIPPQYYTPSSLEKRLQKYEKLINNEKVKISIDFISDESTKNPFMKNLDSLAYSPKALKHI